MNQMEFCWPNKCIAALTFSWDDGTVHDRTLVELMDDFGLRGTFNLNSGKLGVDPGSAWYPFVQPTEVSSLYVNHEVAVHTVNHPRLTTLADCAVFSEIHEDRRALEALVGYPVRGMALPFGDYDERVLSIARAAGMEYVRPVEYQPGFAPPGDFMRWHASAHQNDDIPNLWSQYLTTNRPDRLFYVWGHSYEFHRDATWHLFESFCSLAHRTDGIWCATNGEIRDYVSAVRTLEFSADLHMCRNKTSLPVFLKVNGSAYRVGPGEIRRW